MAKEIEIVKKEYEEKQRRKREREKTSSKDDKEEKDKGKDESKDKDKASPETSKDDEKERDDKVSVLIWWTRSALCERLTDSRQIASIRKGNGTEAKPDDSPRVYSLHK